MERIKGWDRIKILMDLWEYYGGECQFCDRPVMTVRQAKRFNYKYNETAGVIYSETGLVRIGTIEHLTPLEFGGNYNFDNLTLSCMGCNRKRNRRKDHMELLYLYWVNEGSFYGTIMAKDVDKFKLKLQRLCEREGISIRTMGYREVKNPSKSIFKRVLSSDTLTK